MINFSKIITNKGNDLGILSRSSPVMLIFLRHFECVFCKEAIRDLLRLDKEMKDKQVKVVFVHLASPEVADEQFEKQDFLDVEHISDPNCDLYQQFGLSKGTVGQLFGLKVWARGFGLATQGQLMTRKTLGDSLQMPGVFMLRNDKIVDSYIHNSIADKPDYKKLINSCN